MAASQERRIEYVAIDEIKFATANPKSHDIETLTKSVGRFGYGEAPMLDERTGRLVAGHGRIETLRRMAAEARPPPRGIIVKDGKWLAPVQRGWASRTDAEADAYLLASNKLTQAGGWNDDGLVAMLKDLASKDALDGTGFSSEELDELIGASPTDEAQDAPPLPDVSWVKAGDMFELGDHRILCGDSTRKESYERVLGGLQADLLWTDPPYGVSYGEKNEFLNAVGRGNRIQTPIENDSHTTDEMGDFWLEVFSNCLAFCKPGAVYYVTGPQGGDLSMMMMMMQKSGWLLKHVLVWAKNNHVLGRCDYHYKHEPILYGWKPGAGHYWAGGHSETSLWEIDKPHKSDLHPTMKPVELYARGITNSSRRGEIVLDPFSGSGTAIIACESTSRKARAIELSPDYVQVAVERWERLTGKKHVKVK